MKKQLLMVLVIVAAFAGCKRKKKAMKPEKPGTEMYQEVDIPLVDDEKESLTNFFDEDIGEFTLAEADEPEGMDREDEPDRAIDFNQFEDDDFIWEEDDEPEESFRAVHFDFDKEMWRTDEEENIEYNIDLAKRKLEQDDNTMTLVVEGHSDSIYKSAAYNLALSEKRAKNLKDRFVSAGIPEEAIKVVGRGDEYPIILEGQELVGSIDQQAPNRRDEVHVIYA